MTTETRNTAAIGLTNEIILVTRGSNRDRLIALVPAALTAERRATVERIAKRMEDFRGEEDAPAMEAAGPVDEDLLQDVNWNKGYAYHAIGMAAILDEEAAR